MAAISSNKTGIRKALRRLFKKKEDTPVKQDFGISNPETPEEMKKFQEEQDYRRERRQGNKPVNVPKKSIPSVIPAEESPKLKSQKQTKEAKRKEASKPIDEQIKGSVKKKEVKVKSGQDVISDKMSFGKAFRAARNEGMKTFTWRGKKYGTKLKKKEEETKPSTGRYATPQQTPSKPEQGSSVKASKEQISNRLKRLTEQDRKVGGMITTARRYGRNKEAQRLQERYDLIRERQKKLMGQYKDLTGENFPDPRVNKG